MAAVSVKGLLQLLFWQEYINADDAIAFDLHPILTLYMICKDVSDNDWFSNFTTVFTTHEENISDHLSKGTEKHTYIHSCFVIGLSGLGWLV